MAVLTVEISEKLLAQLQQTGRPAQEVVIETVEQAFSNVTPKKEDLFPDEVMQDAYRRFRSDLRNARLISHPADWKTLELAAELAMRYPLKGVTRFK